MCYAFCADVGVLFAILNSNACSLVRHLHVEINIELKHITAEPSAVCSALYLLLLSCVIYYSDQRGECHNQYNEIEKSMVRTAHGEGSVSELECGGMTLSHMCITLLLTC